MQTRKQHSATNLVWYFFLPVALWSHPNHAPILLAQVQPEVRPPLAARTPLPNDGRLSVTIIDAKLRQPTPVRVRITDPAGKPLGLDIPATNPLATEARLAVPGTVTGLPAQAIGVLYGPSDTAQGYAFQPDGAFYVNGSFDLPMPEGRYRITLSKGYEFIRHTEELVVKRGEHLSRNYELKRWADMPERGWYSSDDHIHLRRSPRENPLILDWIAAEDIHVGVLLHMGDFWATYFSQYAWGEKGRYGAGKYVLTSGQEEPRTHELGHTISLGAEKFVRFQDDYYSYDRVFDRIHELGGVSGYAHQGMTFHGYRGMTLDVLTRKIDFLELMQFCSDKGPLALNHYYFFLDLGFKLTALGGSDFPWCGRGPRFGVEQVGAQIGDARFYTYVGNPFSFDRWLQAVKAGHTFVSTGPVLEFQVNGQLPGSSLDVKPGAKLRLTAKAFGHDSQVPLQRLQIIGHGKVLAEVTPGAKGQSSSSLAVDLELGVEHGIWLAARTDAGPTQTAHTTPVYVTVNGDGFHQRSTLAANISTAKGYLQEIRELLKLDARGDTSRPAVRSTPLPSQFVGGAAKLERRIREAEQKLEELSRRQ